MSNIDLTAMAQRYKAMLEDLASKVNGEKDEKSNTYDVQFAYNGINCVAVFDYDDPPFVRIICPNFYPEQRIPDGKLPAVTVALMKSNMKCKGAKLILSRDNTDVSATLEFLEQADEKGAGVLKMETLGRYLQMLFSAVMYARVAFDSQ